MVSTAAGKGLSIRTPGYCSNPAIIRFLYLAHYVFLVLSNTKSCVGAFVGGMQPKYDVFFGNAHFEQFLTHINVGRVLLKPNFTVFNIEVQDGVIEPL